MKYVEENYQSFRHAKDGTEQLCNFVAQIVQEVRYEDGANSQTILTLTGEMPDPDPDVTEPLELPPIDLTAEEFMAMNWVVRKWGARCVVLPGSGVKDDLRTFIQMRSRPPVKTVYKHIGWDKIGGKRVYLHAGGAIGAKGNDPSVSVSLPPELQRYNLASAPDPTEAVTAALDLLNIARRDMTWPLLAGTLAPLYGPVDFGIHVTGRTGSFKSELLSLFQSFYGPEMDARHLPGSWSSSDNALEALAYYAANAVFTIDDFVPQGSSYQQKQYQAKADRIVRNQGNQAGRQRLTDTSSMQTTMFPRGIIFSTGEDTPEGHSVRARLLLHEMTAGEIAADDLTAAQRNRPLYCGVTAWLIQSLAQAPADLKARTEQIRSEERTTGHSRTPGMLGRLIAVAEDFLQRAANDGLVDPKVAQFEAGNARTQILAAGGEQQKFLEEADPVDLFCAAIRQALGSGGGHLRTVNGGIPGYAVVMGWTEERAMGEMHNYKSRGPCIGWVAVKKDELYLDINTGFNVVKKAAGNDLALSKQTLFKRLKDAGALCRSDEARSRNTVRVMAEGHPRQVLCMPLSATLDLKESADGSEQQDQQDPQALDAGE